MPSSAPLVMARLSCEMRVPVRSMLYFSTAYYGNQSTSSNQRSPNMNTNLLDGVAGDTSAILGLDDALLQALQHEFKNECRRIQTLMMSLNGGCSAGAAAFLATVFFSLGAALGLGAAFSLGAAALRRVVGFFSAGAAAFFARAERFGGWFSASDAAAGAGDDAVAACSTSGAGLVAAGAFSGAGEDIICLVMGGGGKKRRAGAWRGA